MALQNLTDRPEGNSLAEPSPPPRRNFGEGRREPRCGLRIVHLSFFDNVGGAAIAAYRLHEGLRRLSLDSRMVVAARSTNDPNVSTVARDRSYRARLQRRLRSQMITRQFARYSRTRPANLDIFSDDRALDPDALRELSGRPGVIHLHWVAGLLDYRWFFRSIPSDVPLVWTLHDMNPFTGGCHYTAGCDRFTAGCGACPALGSVGKFDLSTDIFCRKQRAYDRLRPEKVRIVAPSHWISREASRSALFRPFEITTIPYGLDTEVFRPRPRAVAREVFGIPQGMRIVMCASQSLDNHRKGLDLLIAALDGLEVAGEIGLVSVGKGGLPSPVGETHYPLGDLKTERLMSFAYSAADVFVSPSREDNLPNVLLEAMACGTPAVGFDVGGIRDIIRPGVTGLLVPAGDVRSLRQAIAAILSDDEKREAMSRESRRIAFQEYRLKLQAERYFRLYQQLLTGNGLPMPAIGSGFSSELSDDENEVSAPSAPALAERTPDC